MELFSWTLISLCGPLFALLVAYWKLLSGTLFALILGLNLMTLLSIAGVSWLIGGGLWLGLLFPLGSSLLIIGIYLQTGKGRLPTV